MQKTLKFNSKVSIARDFSKSVFAFQGIAKREDLLSDLRKSLPSQEEIKKNPELLYISANLAVANQINLNSAGMSIATVIDNIDSLTWRPLNIEHDRSRVIGVITGAFFSTYGDNKIISKEEALATLGPVNIGITGIIWKIVNDASEVVEICDIPEFEMFHELSLSWEVGFNTYSAALGSKNLMTATIVSGDQVEEYEEFFSANGGNGFTNDGVEVYMIIENPCKFLGAGLTFSPASAVRGVVCNPILENEKEEEIEAKASNEVKNENILQKEQKNEQIDSQNKKNNVKKVKHMLKIQNKEEVFTLLTEASVDVSTQARINNFLTEQAEAAANEINIKLKAKEDEAVALAADLAEFKQKAANAEASLNTITEKVKELETRAEEDKRQNILEARVDELCSKYALADNPSVKTAVVKQIRDLTDEEYASWMKDMGEPLLASLNTKTPIDPLDATKALKEATASVNIPNAQSINSKDDVSELLKSLQFTK